MDREEEIKTTEEKANEYIKGIEEAMSGYSAHEKNSILLDKVHFWYGSAIDWRSSYEEERNKGLKKIGKDK